MTRFPGRHTNAEHKIFALLSYWKPATRPPETRDFEGLERDHDRIERISEPWRTGAAIMAAALLLCGEARRAIVRGGGPLSFLDNLFTARSKGGQRIPAPRSRSRAAASGAPLPWSGEDGASGHPLMTAARSARRRRISTIASPRCGPTPPAATFRSANFQRFTAGLTPDLRIMDLLDSQPEFTKSIWDYLDILVNDARLARGREILAKYKPQFDAAEKAYGVDRYAIAAIWGIESNYSTQMGDRSVLQSTATLACVGRRQKYFRDEFLSALEILHRGDLRPEQMRGSWAGAFGPTQFMPTAFKRYAVDADGDGRRDVVDDPADLIASTANNLKKDGWQTGQSLGLRGRGARRASITCWRTAPRR